VNVVALLRHQGFVQKQYRAFFGQLLLALSLRGEKVLAAFGGGAHESWRLRAEPAEGACSDPRRVDRELWQYVMGCKQAMRSVSSVSIATDKASVRGLQLQNSIMALPSNMAMVMVPQVAAGARKPPCGGAPEGVDFCWARGPV
jgi:hypothetical protein